MRTPRENLRKDYYNTTEPSWSLIQEDVSQRNQAAEVPEEESKSLTDKRKGMEEDSGLWRSGLLLFNLATKRRQEEPEIRRKEIYTYIHTKSYFDRYVCILKNQENTVYFAPHSWNSDFCFYVLLST